MTLLPLLPSTPHSEHPTTATPSSSSCSPTSLKVDPSTFTFSSTKNGEKQLPDGTKVIQEGQALIHQDPHVFYNPVQEFNRDLSIAVIQAWRVLRTEHQRTLYQTKNKPLSPTYEFTPTVLEALAATGLRSIRYAKEIPYLKKVVCNDLDPNAVESIHKNLILNQVSEELIMPHCGDANKFMYQHRDSMDPFDIIDLDPYGSAAPFLDAAIQNIADHGLLCVTCTDMQVLSGANYSDTCFAKYGGLPLKGDVCHEMALRLLLGCIQRIAARHRKTLIPLMSCSIDFYVRVFVQLRVSPLAVKQTASSMAMVFQCQGCKSIQSQQLGQWKETKGTWTHHQVPTACPECQSGYVMAGPTYIGPLHDTKLVTKVLQQVQENKNKYGTYARILGMVSVISEEVSVPFYMTLRTLSSALHCNSIPMLDLASALLNANYTFSVSHANPIGIKTNAPNKIVWDILRAHAKRSQVKPPAPGTVAHHLLSTPLTWQPDFTFHPKAQPASRKHRLLRFQENPTKDWGPKPKAQRKRKLDEIHPQSSDPHAHSNGPETGVEGGESNTSLGIELDNH